MFQELYMWYMIHASEAGAEPTDPAAPKKTQTDHPADVAALKYYIKMDNIQPGLRGNCRVAETRA